MLSLLRKIAGRGEPKPSNEIVIEHRDCHCHVIPAVDDGSRAMEESLAMLTLLRDDGVRRVIATPHIFPGRFDNEPDPLRVEFGKLEEARRRANIDIELELGAEHYLDDSLLARIERGDILAFGTEQYVLFETHTGQHQPGPLMDVVFALRERGFTPLVAHVERYHYLRGEEGQELCEDLRSAGARFQVNRTVGKVNVPGRGPRGIFIAMLQQRGWIDEVGSDLHRPTKEGRPYLDAPNAAASAVPA